MNGKQRLFYALWPTVSQQNKWAEQAALWLPEGSGRRVKADNLHITLLFLGDVSAGQLRALKEKTDACRGRAFNLTMDKFGYWRKPKVAWLGVSSVPEALQELAAALAAIARSCDIPVESRPYCPHLTLARKVDRSPGRVEVVPQSWPVDHFVLVKSELTPVGAEYKVLYTWELGDG